MAASAQLLLSALSKPVPSPCACAHDDGYLPEFDGPLPAGSGSGAPAEPPLTSEPPLADATPLTSEPPLATELPLTSEPTATVHGPVFGTESSEV
ncbi:hypothetical protein ACFWAT_20085 [Streptomyces syringium]|uniref:hypothetical protein n=1 Tax=Streptomyces syringium TaxID=76729 RepID=UPI00364ADC25